MNLLWKIDRDVSALHAAHCLNRFADSCHRASPELIQTARGLAIAGDALALAPEHFWEMLIVLSVNTPANTRLAERLTLRSPAAGVRSKLNPSPLAAAIAVQKSQFARDNPNFEAEMRLRMQPLKQQWEAYGPGLLRCIGIFSDASLIVESAEVILVQPILGGDGMAHLATNRCHLEAVLTNVDPQLSETIRLAWLLSQLNMERPVVSESINAFRLPLVARLAMLAPTLKAAQELGLCSFTGESVEHALRLWRLAPSGSDHQRLSQVIMSWWETFETDRPEWSVAMAGLDRLLQ